MSCDVPFLGIDSRTVPPAYPQREASRRQKYSTKWRYARERGFFCRLAIGGKRRRNAALTHGAPNKEREGGRKGRGLRGQSERIVRKWGEDCERIMRWWREDCESTVRVALTYG